MNHAIKNLFFLFVLITSFGCQPNKEEVPLTNFNGYWKAVGTFDIATSSFQLYGEKKYDQIQLIHIDNSNQVYIEKSFDSSTSSQTQILTVKAGKIGVTSETKSNLSYSDDAFYGFDQNTNSNQIKQPTTEFELLNPTEMVILRSDENDTLVPWMKLIKVSEDTVNAQKTEYLKSSFQKSQKLNHFITLFTNKTIVLISKTDRYIDPNGQEKIQKILANEVQEIEGAANSPRYNIKYLQVKSPQYAIMNIQVPTIMDARLLKSSKNLEVLFHSKNLSKSQQLFKAEVSAFSESAFTLTTVRDYPEKGLQNVTSIFNFKVLE